MWLFSVIVLSAAAAKPATIPWNQLRNSVLSYPNWSIKDPAVALQAGEFYVFFSAFYKDHGQIRSHVVEVSTRDFRTFSPPLMNFDGEESGWLGMCTPDVQRVGDVWVLAFNSWGDDPQRPDQLFYVTSRDLVHWSSRLPLAANLTAGQSVIGPSVTCDDHGCYGAWREGLEDYPDKIRIRIAAAAKLNGPWHYVGSGYGSLKMANGRDNGLIHENYQFLRIDGVLHMLSDDYRDNLEGQYLYALLDPSHPLDWGKGFELKVPLQSFNRGIRCQAAALYDWRAQDGYFYLIYAGANEQTSYLGRGWNRLALARSRDLIHWFQAGEDETKAPPRW